jgi:hypothetical protein
MREKPGMKTYRKTVTGKLSLWLGLVGLVLFSSPLLAVNCTPDSITLSSQAEVDSFQADHGPGCDTIVTNLTVTGLSITDLTPLSGLTTTLVNSQFLIQGTSATSLAGLSGLTNVFWIEINNNSALSNIDALSALSSVSGPVLISGNPVLTNVNGLAGLTSLPGGALFLENNATLSDLSGVSNLTHIGASLVIINNDALTNLDSLAGLTSVAASLHVSENDVLTSISGLSGVTNFSAALNIRQNNSLASLAGLPTVTSLDGLAIMWNPLLTNLDSLSGLTTITHSGLNIIGNIALTSIDGLAAMVSSDSRVEISGNTALSQCSSLLILLDQVDDALPGPGPGVAGIPDVNGDVTVSGNLDGCNSIGDIVGKENQTITDFAAIPATGVAGGSSGLSATASSGLAVAFDSSTTAVCTVADTTVSYLMAGTCTVTADQDGDDTYNAAPQVTLDITVGTATDETTARFNVTKTFSDGNTASVEVTLSCNTGIPLQQSAMIDGGDLTGVTFIVTSFEDGAMDCTVSETDSPDGYAVSYDDCAWAGVNGGDSNVCVVNNAVDDVIFRVNKVWEIDTGGSDIDTSVDITVTCNSPITNNGAVEDNGTWRYTETTFGTDYIDADVTPMRPYTTCSATESSLPSSAVETDNQCSGIELSVGNGNECTITNTVFFEGIPTLDRYGLAVLIFLMLGVGFVGLRRFA